MKILTKIYYWILSALAVVGMIGYIGAVVIQVFSRTFLPFVPSWTEEAARYLFIYSPLFLLLAADGCRSEVRLIRTVSEQLRRLRSVPGSE